jgi:hypothetical protein
VLGFCDRARGGIEFGAVVVGASMFGRVTGPRVLAGNELR